MYFPSDIKLFLLKLILPMGCVDDPIALKVYEVTHSI